jgi:UDP-glucose 4-epimerase
MNILVTGGAGYIGSHIIELLVKNKTNKVVVLDNLSTGYKILINKKSKFFKGDINNKKLIIKIINKFNIDTIIHLAASLNVSEAQKNKKKYYKNNITGTNNLLLSCKNTTVKNIIFSSSCSIYGNIKGSVNERKKPNPKGYYALTKYKGEELIKKYALKFNYNFGILRYFNVAGASPSGRIGEIETSHGHLIKNIAIQSMNKKPKLNIYGNNYNTKDGTCVRDYIHVTDLADIHIKGIKYLKVNKKSFILNCGYGKGYSVLQIANKFKKIKKNTQINFMKRRSGDIAQVFSDTKKFKKLLKWKPRYNDINKIIKSAINWEVKLKIYRKKI